MLLAAIYWDPDPVAFKIPFIQHPVVWYGVLFAFGFLLGHYLLRYLYNSYIRSRPEITEFEIHNWLLYAEIFEKTPSLNTQLSSKSQKELKNSLKKKHIDPSLQSTLHKGMQQYIAAHPDTTREKLEALFSGAVHTSKESAFHLVDRLTWYVVVATILGARLGHMLFYDLDLLLADPLVFFRTWEGGLASHGAAAGIIISLILYERKTVKEFPYIRTLFVLDTLAIPTALVGAMIRLGNFINQEIVGIPSDAPWAVLFGHPREGLVAVPRHPVQLYEAIAYFCSFFILLGLWKKFSFKFNGFLIGVFFLLIFGSRFFLEYLKVPQSEFIHEGSFLLMGQWLSIPFIVTACVLIWKNLRKALQT